MKTVTVAGDCCCCNCIGVDLFFSTGNRGGPVGETDFMWTASDIDGPLDTPVIVNPDSVDWPASDETSSWISTFGEDADSSGGPNLVTYGTTFRVTTSEFLFLDDVGMCFRTMSDSCITSIVINTTEVYHLDGDCPDSPDPSQNWKAWGFKQNPDTALPFVEGENTIAITVKNNIIPSMIAKSGIRVESHCDNIGTGSCFDGGDELIQIPLTVNVRYVYGWTLPAPGGVVFWDTTAVAVYVSNSQIIWRIQGQPHLLIDCDDGNQEGKIDIRQHPGFGYGENIIAYDCASNTGQWPQKIQGPVLLEPAGITTTTAGPINPLYMLFQLGGGGTSFLYCSDANGGTRQGVWYAEVTGPALFRAPLIVTSEAPSPTARKTTSAKKGCCGKKGQRKTN